MTEMHWRSSFLDRLLDMCLLEDADHGWTVIRETVRRQPGSAAFFQPPDGTHRADAITCMFGAPGGVVVGKARTPFPLSPVAWMEKRAVGGPKGQPIGFTRRMRNHFLRRRLCRRWNLWIIETEQFAKRVLDLRRGSSKANFTERLLVLPQILHSIKCQKVRLCLVSSLRPWDDLRRFTLNEDWRVEWQYRPKDRAPVRLYLAAGSDVADVNRLWKKRIGKLYFGSMSLDEDVLWNAYESGAVYEKSKETLLTIVDNIQSVGKGQSLSRRQVDTIESVRRAIVTGAPFAEEEAFTLAKEYHPQKSDIAETCGFIRRCVSAVGVSEELCRNVEDIERGQGYQSVLSDELDFDDEQETAYWHGKAILVSTGIEYALLRRLAEVPNETVEYSELLAASKPSQYSGKSVCFSPEDLRTPISRLRGKLQDATGGRVDISVTRGRGYVLRIR